MSNEVTEGSNDLESAALRYAELGWAVFPLAERAKVPRKGSKGLLDATTDRYTVWQWWQEEPQSNIGVNCGRSGLVVIDVDVRNGGAKTWAELTTQYGDGISRTVAANTGGGGRHFFYRRGWKPIKSAGGLLGPGVDVKSEGGYIILPPSVHPSGRPYAWLRDPWSVNPSPFPPELEAICAATPPSPAVEAPPPPSGPLRENAADYWLARALERAVPGTRNETGFWLACQLRDERVPKEEARGVLLDYASRVTGLAPEPYTEREALASLEEAYSRAPREPAVIPLPPRAPTPVNIDPGDVDPEVLNALHMTDSGNAEAMALLFGDRLRFAHMQARTRDIVGAWLVWAGHYWRPNAMGAVDQLALATARARQDAARVLPSEDGPSPQAKWALGSESARRRKDMIALARSEPQIAARFEDFDTDPWLLGTENGVLDLRTGQLRPGRQSDMITKSVGYAFDPDATCPRWLRFLEEVFDGEESLIDFVRRAAGYSLTGTTREQCMFLCHGRGANGKSTLLATLRAVLGDYGANTPFSTFELSSAKGASNTNDLAALAGARLVCATETAEARRLNEARVKAVTGGDAVTARFLYTEFFTYTPSFKVWLAMNALPRIVGLDDGIWRRIRLIPFRISFKGREDKNLEATLRAEVPGILNWAIEGCLEWQQYGDLLAPSAVIKATDAYREESDTIGQFLAEETVPAPADERVRASELYAAYMRWCQENGEKYETGTAFGRRLADRGIVKKKTMTGAYYYGLRLINPSTVGEWEG